MEPLDASIPNQKMTEEEALQWWKDISVTKLYRLAHYNLVKTKQCRKETYNGVDFYEPHPIEVIIEGIRLLNIAHKKKVNLNDLR